MSKPAIMHAQQLQYTISVPEPHTHYIDAEIKTKGFKQRIIDLKMPVWAPGSYLVREFADQVEAFKAKDALGTALEVQKLDKSNK